MSDLLAVQPLLLGAILLWSGYVKLLGRLASARAARTALPRLVGADRATAAYRATGVVELILAAVLLIPAPWWWEPLAASGLTLGFLCFLGYSRVAAPDSSCGCLGSVSAPVSARTMVRAVLLVASAGSMFLADRSWTSALAGHPVTAGLLAVGGLVVFVGLSAELDRWWLLPLRRARVRLTHPLAGRSTHTPLASTVQQLLRSPAYRSVAASLRSDVREHWDEGEWRFVTYAAAHGDGFATGVFAVPLVGYEPDAVRVAIVDERTGTALYRPEPAAPTGTI